MREHSINELDNFIGGWYIPADVCDSVVEYSRKNLEKFFDTEKTLESVDQKPGVKNHVYNNFNLNDEGLQLRDKYFSNLINVHKLYVEKYKWCTEVFYHGLGIDYKIQYYAPGRYYSDFHCENGGKDLSVFRHLVFMTYLNDVADGGETEFMYQKIKIKPEKGLTLIWPVQWTHTHRGWPSQSDKFIVTGWWYFQNKMTEPRLDWTKPISLDATKTVMPAWP